VEAEEVNDMSGAEVIRKGIELINKHDAAGFAAQYSADAVVQDPTYEEPLKGRGAIENDMMTFFTAFPDMRVTLGAVLEGGDTTAVEFTMTGTNTGPLALPSGEVPATGKPLAFPGAIFFSLNEQGEVVNERRYFDIAGQLAQLGVSL
jgi:steroid delta-isomerase-like uncharacterized protein